MGFLTFVAVSVVRRSSRGLNGSLEKRDMQETWRWSPAPSQVLTIMPFQWQELGERPREQKPILDPRPSGTLLTWSGMGDLKGESF